MEGQEAAKEAPSSLEVTTASANANVNAGNNKKSPRQSKQTPKSTKSELPQYKYPLQK